MKKIALILTVLMLTLAVAMPISATGSTTTFKEGEIIYCQNFSGIPDTDDLTAIESTLGYRVVKVDTTEATLGYKITEKNVSDTIVYSVKNGKLAIDNSAEGGAYSYLFVYDSDYMKELVKTTYTVQYEITYEAGSENYCNPILNWDEEFTFQTPMLRGNGTYRNQVRYTDRTAKTNKWYDWDGMSGQWLQSALTQNETALLENVVVRLVSVPDKGVYVYANEFLVSAPNEIASAPEACLPGNIPYSAVGLRLQKGAKVTIDNLAIYAGVGSKFTPNFAEYGFTGLPPVVESTEAPETSKTPVESSTSSDQTTKAPDTTTKPVEKTDPPATDNTPNGTTPAPETKKGCGSSVSAGLVILAAIIPAAVITKKKK